MTHTVRKPFIYLYLFGWVTFIIRNKYEQGMNIRKKVAKKERVALDNETFI